jgi:hypothetical protein
VQVFNGTLLVFLVMGDYFRKNKVTLRCGSPNISPGSEK